MPFTSSLPNSYLKLRSNSPSLSLRLYSTGTPPFPFSVFMSLA